MAAAAALWGTNGTAQALGPDGISPESAGWLRMAGGALLVGWAIARRETVPLRTLPRWPLLFAILSMAASQPLFFTGVARTGVAVGTVVTIGCGPILAGVLAWMVRGERPGRRWAIATAMAVAGAVLLVSGGDAAGVDPGGLAFSLAAGFTWAVYLVAAKALFDGQSAVFVAGVVFTGAAGLLAPLLLVGEVAWMASGSGVVVVLWLTLVTTAGSYVLFAIGLRHTAVATAATLTLAEPVTAALLGMTVLGEPVRASTVAGIVLVAFGLLVLSVRVEGRAPVGG